MENSVVILQKLKIVKEKAVKKRTHKTRDL